MQRVPKYGRDDLVPQIRRQLDVIQAVESGWEPVVPLKRVALPREKLGFSRSGKCD